MRFTRALLTSLFLAFLLSAGSVFAQQSIDLQNYLGSWFNVETLVKFIFPGFPDEWLRIPNVIYYVFIPFITAFTVIYGLLKELRIFRLAPNKVNIMIAFSMAFLMMPSGMLTWIVTYFYVAGAFIGVIAFMVVFIIGVFLWGYGTSWRFWEEQVPESVRHGRDMRRQMTNMTNEIERIENEMAREIAAHGDSYHARALENRRQTLITTREQYRRRMAHLENLQIT